MRTLDIDIETYSDVPIELGVYRYADTPQFRILLFAYKIDDGPVEVIDLTSDALPETVRDWLTDETIIKTAFHAQFERVCINKYFNLQSKNWECTKVLAAYMGLDGSLDSVSQALGVKADAGKIKDGKRLIRKFSVPQRETKKRPTAAPYTKEEAPEDWAKFIEYCRRDVEVEAYIRDKLSWAKVPPAEKTLYTIDQAINDRGVGVDRLMAAGALAINDRLMADQGDRFTELTGIDSTNKLGLFKSWLSKRAGQTIDQVTKSNRDELEDIFRDDPVALEALGCRYAAGKSSIAKYDMMLRACCADGRVRGTLQFYGAQTGRWAGRLVQVQNLPQNHLQDLDTARAVVKSGDYDIMTTCYSNPGDVLSQCIRPTLIPAEGCRFVVADFSAIEARVVAWLAGEDWVTEVFRTHGKIYEATASKMLKIPLHSIKKGSPERQKGKVATLALGYQGGVGALKAMGALKMGIPEDDLQGIVDAWRQSNPHIVNYWYAVERAVRETIATRALRVVQDRVRIYKDKGFVFIELPSGRALAYPRMTLRPSDTFVGRDQLCYAAIKSGGGGFRVVDTYGGRLTENIVQATARDCLAHTLIRLEEEGFRTVMHVHDEVVVEVDRSDRLALDRIKAIMSEPISWADGLYLTADAYTCDYYRKD